MRQLAEKLAKAQFAAKRDPHDCTLMYIALGKKTLLQVTRQSSSTAADILRLVRLGMPCSAGCEGEDCWQCLI